jgi:type I restriction enzyme S subunit
VIDKTGTEKYLRVCPGDIAYNTMRMWQGSCGVVREEGIISSAYTVLTPVSNKVDPKFWNYAFHTPQLLDAFRRYSTGVAADRWRLYYRNFAKISVREPTLERQRQLVASFEEIEEAKAQSEKHQESLAETLRSMLNSCTQYTPMAV